MKKFLFIKVQHSISFTVVIFALLEEFKSRHNHNVKIYDVVRSRILRRLFIIFFFISYAHLKNMALVDAKGNFSSIGSCWHVGRVFLEAYLVVVCDYQVPDFRIVCRYVMNKTG